MRHPTGPSELRPYGVVVDSVKVRALEYVPVRSGSLAVDELRELERHRSLEIGAVQLSRFSGEAEEPTLLNAVPVLAALRARACSGCGRTNAPLTSWPVPVVLGSDDAQQRVTGRGDHVGRGRGRVGPGDARGERAELGRRAERQASVAGTVPLTPPLVLVAVSTV